MSKATDEAERMFRESRKMSFYEEERERTLANMAKQRAERLAKEAAEGPPKSRHRI
jgi:hypothetical protein